MSQESLTESNRRIITDYARLVFTELDPKTAFDRYVRTTYIQHNPQVIDGPEATLEFLQESLAKPGLRCDIQRILVDGDHALVHVRVSEPGKPAKANCDLYRLEDGLVVEHWDVIQVIPDDAVSDHPMF